MHIHDSSPVQQQGRQIQVREEEARRTEEPQKSEGSTGEKASGMTVYIYCLCDPETREIRYVGKTTYLRPRLNHHYGLWTHDHKSNWIKSLKSRGLKPIMEELERIENSDDNDWQEVERFYISYLRFLGCRLTNLDPGGRNGKRLTKETRAKISAKSRGKKKSAETRARMSAANRLRKWSEETHRKFSAARRGKPGHPHTPESRAKIGKAQKGKKKSEHQIAMLRGRVHSEETRRKIGAAHRGKKLSAWHLAKLLAAHPGRNRQQNAAQLQFL